MRPSSTWKGRDSVLYPPGHASSRRVIGSIYYGKCPGDAQAPMGPSRRCSREGDARRLNRVAVGGTGRGQDSGRNVPQLRTLSGRVALSTRARRRFFNSESNCRGTRCSPQVYNRTGGRLLVPVFRFGKFRRRVRRGCSECRSRWYRNVEFRAVATHARALAINPSRPFRRRPSSGRNRRRKRALNNQVPYRCVRVRVPYFGRIACVRHGRRSRE